jgi:hypothetical protein
MLPLYIAMPPQGQLSSIYLFFIIICAAGSAPQSSPPFHIDLYRRVLYIDI